MNIQEQPSFKERIKRGWLLTKSSWRVLLLDKELLGLPLINNVIQVGIFGAVLATVLATGLIRFSTNGVESSISWWLIGAVAALLTLIVTFVSNILTGAVIHGALIRFNGGDPTLRGSLNAAMRKWRPILLFSLMMTTVTIVIQFFQEQADKLPVIGSIISQLLLSIAGFAWTVANFFSVAHIISEEQDISPITATKASAGTIKKVWGEGVTSSVGISAIFGLGMLLTGLTGALLSLVTFSVAGIPGAITLGVSAIAGLIIVAIVFDTMEAILTAALFYYAKTGESPETFDRNLLRQSMTRNKAKKVFGGIPKGGKTWA